jgi:hypothetical protein
MLANTSRESKVNRFRFTFSPPRDMICTTFGNRVEIYVTARLLL